MNSTAGVCFTGPAAEAQEDNTERSGDLTVRTMETVNAADELTGPPLHSFPTFPYPHMNCPIKRHEDTLAHADSERS